MKKYNITVSPIISHQYGQDYIGYNQTKDIFIIAIADGHGALCPAGIEGSNFAFYSVLFIISEIFKKKKK